MAGATTDACNQSAQGARIYRAASLPSVPRRLLGEKKDLFISALNIKEGKITITVIH